MGQITELNNKGLEHLQIKKYIELLKKKKINKEKLKSKLSQLL